MIRMTKISPGGVVKFNRYYNYKNNDSTQDYSLGFSSLELCSDGSWIASLESVKYDHQNPFFFVKYDTTGCDTVPGYCLATYTPTGTNTVNVEIPAFSDDFLLSTYPNPVHEALAVETSSEPVTTDIVIYDIYGNKQKQVRLVSRKQSIALDDLSKGIYFLKVYKNGRLVKTQKLLKE